MAKLFKRGKIWHAWVRKRGGGVKRVSTLCTDKRAAEGVIAQLEREAVDPAYAAANKATTQQVIDDYYRSRVRLGRAAGSLHHVRVKAGQMIRLLPARAADISHEGNCAIADKRLAEGVRTTTIKKEFRVLKAALKLAKKNGIWAGDPAAVIPELADDYKPGTRVLTPLELVGLASVLAPHRMAFVAFSVATGCDPSAIFRAKASDVAPDFSMVQIHGTKRESRERGVPLPFAAQRTLVRWALERTPSEGLLFARWASVRRDLHLACAKIGIPGCSPNDLRRTYGTWLREGGVEPSLIGSAMGHVDSRMVERVYGRLTSDALARLLTERVTAAGVMEPAGLEDGAGAVRLVCCASDVSAQTGASGARAELARTSKNSAEKLVLAVRRGGIEPPTRGFSVLDAKATFAAELPSDGEYDVGARALSVLCEGGEDLPLLSAAKIAAQRQTNERGRQGGSGLRRSPWQLAEAMAELQVSA